MSEDMGKLFGKMGEGGIDEAGSSRLAERVAELEAENERLRGELGARDGSSVAAIRSAIESGFARAVDAIRPVAARAEEGVPDELREVACCVRRRVAEHPIASVAISVGAGFVLASALRGLFGGRRRYED